MLNLKNVNKDKIKIVGEKQQEKKLQYLGSVRPQRGHTLFKFNSKTGEITPAEFKKTDVIYNQDVKKLKKKRKVIIEKDCVYISALNLKNAKRKLKI